jgi:DNA-binding winged helix-turn-helix (wHTH) protein
MKVSQNDLVMMHIRRAGSISQREALMDYSIQSLTARIHTLRKRGYKIKMKQHVHPTTGQKYARYYL